MPIRFSSNISVSSRSTTSFTTGSRGVFLLCGMLLVGGALVLLWVERGFAQYAFTGLWWIRTAGTVTDSMTTSIPTVQFTARDGSSVLFQEDYILMCGSSRSFCWIRDFKPGQIVPVVYDPAEPKLAYVHDWALTANVLGWFAVAVIGLLFALIMCLRLMKGPISFSLRGGASSDPG